MDPDIFAVCLDRKRFHAAQVVLLPDVQPFPQRHFTWLLIGPIIDNHSSSLYLLPDLLLCLAGKGLLYLFPCSGIMANGDPALPISVLLALAGDCFLADRPAPLGRSGILSCH